jgi:hypothetical protein
MKLSKHATEIQMVSQGNNNQYGYNDNNNNAKVFIHGAFSWVIKVLMM